MHCISLILRTSQEYRQYDDDHENWTARLLYESGQHVRFAVGRSEKSSVSVSESGRSCSMDLKEAKKVGMERNTKDALEFTHGRNLLPGNAALDAFDGTLNRRIVTDR